MMDPWICLIKKVNTLIDKILNKVGLCGVNEVERIKVEVRGLRVLLGHADQGLKEIEGLRKSNFILQSKLNLAVKTKANNDRKEKTELKQLAEEKARMMADVRDATSSLRDLQSMKDNLLKECNEIKLEIQGFGFKRENFDTQQKVTEYKKIAANLKQECIDLLGRKDGLTEFSIWFGALGIGGKLKECLMEEISKNWPATKDQVINAARTGLAIRVSGMTPEFLVELRAALGVTGAFDADARPSSLGYSDSLVAHGGEHNFDKAVAMSVDCDSSIRQGNSYEK